MDIAAWLRRLGLEDYIGLFAANDIDQATLALLTADDLKEMGVLSVGHRRRLLTAIAGLSAAQPQGRVPPAAGEPADPMSERREVTVLFADIAGFTTLATGLDAEHVHGLLAQFFDKADAIITAEGGRIDKHIGDCVMGVFGAPIAHPDDIERAARAAERIHKSMVELSASEQRPLEAHVGLAAGEVVASTTGSAQFREYTVTGETVNLASRLCALARGGETIVSDAILRNLAGRIAVEPLGAQSIKGFAQPVIAWRLLGLKERDGGDKPIFGRRAELAQLATALDIALETRRGTVAVVRGEAGIGKSRLVEEIAHRAEAGGWRVRWARVLEFTAGSTSDPLAALGHDLIADLAPIEPGAGSARVQALAERIGLPNELRLALEELAGSELAAEDRRRFAAMPEDARISMRHQALTALAAAMAMERPLLLLVEDVHWATEATLAGLGTLARSATGSQPVVVMMTTRNEGDPSRRPDFAAGAHSLTIDLGPLATEDARAHVASLLAGARSQVEQCVARAQGNPLFLEQLARHTAAGGLDEALPSSIRSAVLARIDRLKPADKQVLQAAAVLGDQFTENALGYVAGAPAQDPAALLEARLLVRAGDVYRFGHALIRQGVYGSLLHSVRERLHRRAADWHADRDLALRAEHLARARAPEAVGAYLEAAAALAAAYRTDLALDLVGRAKAIADLPADRLRLALVEGDYLLEVGRAGDAVAAYEQAEGHAQTPVDRAMAQLGKAGALRVIDRLDGAMQLIEEATPALAQSQRTDQLARLEHLRGNLLFPLGQSAACEAAHQKAYAYAQAAGHAELQARALGGLADAAYARGLYLTTSERLGACIALAQQHGLGRVEVANLPMLAAARMFSGGGSEIVGTAIEAATQARQPRAELIARHIAMVGHLWSGEPARVEPHFDRAQAIIEQLGARRFEPENLVFLADAKRQLGDWAEARRLADRAYSIIREHGFVYFAAIVQGCRALAYFEDEQTRREALDDGIARIRAGSIAHDPLFFTYYGIEACLLAGDSVRARLLSDLVDEAFKAEPSPFTRLLSTRGRLIAEAGETGLTDPLKGRLEQCRADSLAMRYTAFVPLIDKAVARGGAGSLRPSSP